MQIRPTRMQLPSLAACVLLLGLLSLGCATADTASLDRARAAVQKVADDPVVDAKGSPHMREAQRLLKVADQVVDDRGAQEIVDHNAYLAKTHAEVALARAQARFLSQKKSESLVEVREEAAVLEQAERRAKALEANQTVRGMVLTLEGVSFDYDSVDLKADAKRALLRLAGFLIALPDRDVLIEGFTDDTGKAEYNLELSLRRAESVRNELVGGGVEVERILAEGLGKELPIAGNDSADGRARNRRVEVLILEPGESARGASRKKM